MITFIVMLFLLPAACLAETVRVGIGFSIPPYVIKEEESGVEVEIIREAFKLVGYQVEFVYLPNLRMPVAFAEGSIDCVVTNAAYDLTADSGVPAHYSVTTLEFQNYAITIEAKKKVITSIGGLRDVSVLAFDNAAKSLGSEFAAMAAANCQYTELADQALQVRMLFSGRVDVIVSDKRVFTYWRKKLSRSFLAEAVAVDQRVSFHSIFSPTPRHVGFRDDRLRALFDKGLEDLRCNGGYEIIEERYSSIEVP